MSLYEDIIVGPKVPAKIGTAQIKLLQEHLQAKKRASSMDTLNNSKNPRLAGQSSGASTSSVNAASTSSGAVSAASLLGGDWDPRNEYDPLWPNDFETVERLAREQAQSEYNDERDRKGSKKSKYRHNSDSCDQNSLSSDHSESDFEDGRPTLRGIQGYSEDGDDAKNEIRTHKAQSPSRAQSQQFPGISSVAAKIMSKMGYREGQGLGKDEQGINRALEVEKIGNKVAKIVDSSQQQTISEQTESKIATDSGIAEIIKNPTRVVLLRNMVGPGEVDDELDGETREECSKYGEVVNCLIFEIPNKRVPDDEAVRIFIEFKSVESAIKAVVDLNGRFFAGRAVKASFYDVDKFNKFELAPSLPSSSSNR